MGKNEMNLKLLESITGTDIFHKILEVLSGERIYIPGRGKYSSIGERNNAIWIDFCAGCNINDLVDKYNLSVSSIYRIIDRRD